MTYLHAFSLAWALCTRVPLPSRCFPQHISARVQSLSVLFYPLVGLLLGALLLALYAVLPGGIDAFVSAVIVLSAWVALTGAMHLDGLADSIDAYCAGHKGGAVVLDVFKDPASGPTAVVAIVLVLLSKVAALSVLIEHQQWIPLVAALFIGRWLLFPFMAFTPYVREGGLASDMAVRPFIKSWLVVSAVGLAVIAALSPIVLLWLLAAGAFAYYWRYIWLKTIGGYVGDCLGALIEITETLVLVLAVLSCC